jgi:hypothetical protein
VLLPCSRNLCTLKETKNRRRRAFVILTIDNRSLRSTIDNSMIDLSIIIVSFNAWGDLEESLAAPLESENVQPRDVCADRKVSARRRVRCAGCDAEI